MLYRKLYGETAAVSTDIYIKHKTAAVSTDIYIKHKTAAVITDIYIKHKTAAVSTDIYIKHKTAAVSTDIYILVKHKNAMCGQKVDIFLNFKLGSSRNCRDKVQTILSLSSTYICHGVGPLVDPFRSHVSRNLFKVLPRFLLPVGE
jgi:hypothetical protein